MVFLVVVIISLLLAYRGMSAGLLSVLGRCATGALSIAVAVGFAGPLRTAIPWTSPYLYGACLLLLAVIPYVVQRILVSYYMLENEVALPDWVDRLGGAVLAFLGGLMLSGFVSLLLLVVPLPRALAELESHLELSAQNGLAPARAIGAFADAGKPLYLRTVRPQPDPPPPAIANPFANQTDTAPAAEPVKRQPRRKLPEDSLFSDTQHSP